MTPFNTKRSLTTTKLLQNTTTSNLSRRCSTVEKKILLPPRSRSRYWPCWPLETFFISLRNKLGILQRACESIQRGGLGDLIAPTGPWWKTSGHLSTHPGFSDCERKRKGVPSTFVDQLSDVVSQACTAILPLDEKNTGEAQEVLLCPVLCASRSWLMGCLG